MSFTVSAGFIGIFKLGDNVAFNLRVLAQLYAIQKKRGSSARLLCKPITVILVSISEAFLYDLFSRMKNFTKEGVGNLAKEVLEQEQQVTRDKLKVLIDGAKKHDVLGDSTGQIYKELDQLREIRNRIHIQNADGKLERNESDVFTLTRQHMAERVVEQIVNCASRRYLRPPSVRGHVDDFEFPWKRRLPAPA